MNPTPQIIPTTSASLAAKPTSVPALVTFWLLAIWTLTVTGVFVLIFERVTLSTIMFGVLTAAIATTTTLLTSAAGFWLGTSIGAKASGDAIAASAATSGAALATIAGAPQPIVPPSPSPAPPNGNTLKPARVSIVSSEAEPVIVEEAASPLGHKE